MSDSETAWSEPIREADVRAFIHRLNAWRGQLAPRDQVLLDSLVMAAADSRADVEGYDNGPNITWIFPPGLVDDLAWIRLSRECRIRGGIEEVLDPGAQGQGARIWGCRPPVALGLGERQDDAVVEDGFDAVEGDEEVWERWAVEVKVVVAQRFDDAEAVGVGGADLHARVELGADGGGGGAGWRVARFAAVYAAAGVFALLGVARRRDFVADRPRQARLVR